MTCIVGIAKQGTVWIGGDACGSTEMFKTTVLHPKVFTRSVPTSRKNITDTMLIGGAGPFRMLQLLEHALKIPKISHARDTMEWLVLDFAEACRTLFSTHGSMHRVSETDAIAGYGSFLIGFRGILCSMDNNFQVFVSEQQEAAAGSGMYYALGSLHSTRGQDPEARILAALDAAVAYSPSCSPPFTICEL